MAGQPPDGWSGWPGGKQFALVLTHDVESQQGLDHCRRLAELESRLGFRSSFNFIPEGDYSTPKELRDWLVANGFETGVHDLRHDGKLYLSASTFRSNASRINRYLEQWSAVGFRSGFMLGRLDWLHSLNVLYDASTFDTDPFEPQPNGADTIFPFWVPAPPARNSGAEPRNADAIFGSRSSPRTGYVELPYTLAQDITLFVLLRERTTELWGKKFEWIVQKGGMVLLNTHPDYMDFNNDDKDPRKFPVLLYEQFLRNVKSRFQGRYWHALPRETAEFVREQGSAPRLRPTPNNEAAHRAIANVHPKIWIDLENTPHIPFFKPIIGELEKRGYRVVLTARDAFQVCELARLHGLACTEIGRHYGKNSLLKACGLVWRSTQLIPFAFREKPVLALNHGSRAQILLCNVLRIPSVMIMDYEYTIAAPLVRPRWEIVPEALSEEELHCRKKERVRTYQGIKEDVYASGFKPDPSILPQLGLKADDIIVTVRPPATEAHYHNPESETLFVEFMNRACDTSGVKVVLLPRNKRQESEMRTNWPEWFKSSKVIVPTRAVDGLNLLWHSDLAVSGGGTMNREAAALRIPVYSIFRGRIGAVDRVLQQEGRLVLIENGREVHEKILLDHRKKGGMPDCRPSKALVEIVDHIEKIFERECASTRSSKS